MEIPQGDDGETAGAPWRLHGDTMGTPWGCCEDNLGAPWLEGALLHGEDVTPWRPFLTGRRSEHAAGAQLHHHGDRVRPKGTDTHRRLRLQGERGEDGRAVMGRAAGGREVTRCASSGHQGVLGAGDLPAGHS